jgi:hypothetical protein
MAAQFYVIDEELIGPGQTGWQAILFDEAGSLRKRRVMDFEIR